MKFTQLLLFILLLNTSLNAQWSTPIELLPGTAAPATMIGGGNQPIGPAIATSLQADGNIRVVWANQMINGGVDIFTSVMYGKGQYGPVMNLSQSMDKYSLSPVILAMPSGNICIAWSEFDKEFSEGIIQVRILDNSGNWSPAFSTTPSLGTLSIYPSLAFLASPTELLVAYTELTVDENGEQENYTPRFEVMDIETGEVKPFSSPYVNESVHNFRVTVLNEGLNRIHCAWYDTPDDFDQGYDSFIAYSCYENQNWSQPVNLSAENTVTTWDDGPIRLVLDNSNNLHVVWTAFAPLPSRSYMVVKHTDGSFSEPIAVFEDETLNWAYAISKNGKLHCLGVDKNLIQHYVYNNQKFEVQKPLNVTDDYPSYFPSAVILMDTLHVFWTKNNKLMYAYLSLKSSSVLSAGYGDVNVQVYPTPFETHVVIKADTDCEGCLAIIYDLNGRAISTVNLLGETLMQLGNLPNGPYQLVISRANVPVFRTTIFKQAQGKS